jgi:hypothetical protein
MVDYLFEISCSGILLFVDSQNKALISFIQDGLGMSEFLWCQWLFILHPAPPDAIDRRTLTFTSIDMILELTLLVWLV